MVRATRPLLCRSPLHPGESLASFLIRLATRNHYQPSTILERLCLAGSSDIKASYPAQAVTFQRWADLTLIEPTQLYQATIHRFAPVLTPPGEGWPTVTLSETQTKPLLSTRLPGKFLRPETAAQFCPPCLGQVAYHRLVWMPVAVTTCLEHQCLLVKPCCRCQQTLSIQAIVSGQCSHCQTDLRLTPALPIADDTVGLRAQHVLQSWLMTGLTPETPGATLPAQPAGVLYHLMDGLRVSFLSLAPNWPYFHQTPVAAPPFANRGRPFHQATPVQNHILQTTAFKTIMNWPESFYDLLHVYRGGQNNSIKHFPTDFASLYTHFLEKRWQHPAFQFVQDAFNQYLVDHYARTHTLHGPPRCQAIADRFAYMSVFEAAEVLETSFDFVLQLIGSGQLTPYPPQDLDYLPHPFVNRTEFFAWYSQHCLSSIATTAQQLDLLPTVITDLVRMGLLEAEDDPQVGETYRGHIRKKSINLFLNKLSRRLLMPRRGLIDWATATQMVAGADLNEAHLLQALIQNQLCGFGIGVSLFGLKKLRFAEPELKDLVVKKRHKTTVHSPEDGQLD